MLGRDPDRPNRRQRWEELSDDEKIERLRELLRGLMLAVVALTVAVALGAVLFVINDNIRAARTLDRDREARTQACATIYNAEAGNPYVLQLIKEHPDCTLPDRLSGLAPARRSSSARPQAVKPTTDPTNRAAESDSPGSPSQGRTPRPVRTPSAATRTRPASSGSAPTPRKTTKAATRTPSRGTSGGQSATASATPALCVSVDLGLLGAHLGCS